MGARPKIPSACVGNCSDHILTLRDVESVQRLTDYLQDVNIQKLLVVGNGGIAAELVYALRQRMDIIWAIRDSSIVKTFIDPGAAEFFLNVLNENQAVVRPQRNDCQERLVTTHSIARQAVPGHAVGLDWLKQTDLVSALTSFAGCKSLQVIYNVEVVHVTTQSDPEESNVCVGLSNDSVHECDFVVCATGVVANGDIISCKPNLRLQDGAVCVDQYMRTNVTDVFAAGDVCELKSVSSLHWFQMRLWTQARTMGLYVARCMQMEVLNNEAVLLHSFSFEMFSHVTSFFGFKVILLGLFDGRGLVGDDVELLVRVDKGQEFVKCVMKDGRMRGAILIGETGLEETFENLILNQLDLSRFGQDLLDPSVDIEDYFD